MPVTKSAVKTEAGHVTAQREFRVEAWGKYALFTDPAFKAERRTYPVPTPSAIKGFFEAIYWKPQFQWIPTWIVVRNVIRHVAHRHNEIESFGLGKKSWDQPVLADEQRQPRTSSMLWEPRYVFGARIRVPVDCGDIAREIAKHERMFTDRARRGACWRQPFFGTSECIADFRLLGDDEELPPACPDLVGKRIELGPMLHSILWRDGIKDQSVYYRPVMVDGRIDIGDVEVREAV